ncbi:hypothetical protein [Indioceanicola profundi]|uniref:hypothetical protein n=1 Tax=Indioceanicola profundi TaxID=2220096 RepID=UPI000E6ADBE1|nr:hypothetical protein [Indioceanicola profundi]
MSAGLLIPILALLIPIVAIVTREMRKWQRLDVEAAKRDVDVRRHVRALEQIEKRVGDIEAYVTSPEFQLNRELGRLADQP